MTVLKVRHTTVYRYRRRVRLGDHRLMLRPRDSHDLRLIGTDLNFSPPASVRWVHDVFGNSVAIASFDQPATELRIESCLELETYVVEQPVPLIASDAASYPFIYSADDRIDLGRMLERHHPDPQHRLRTWADGFIHSRPTGTLALLADLNAGVSVDLVPEPRRGRNSDPDRDAQPRLGLVPRSGHAADRGRTQSRIRRTGRDGISP
jgi:transglutaminase-like putative cysteine protease